MIEGNREDEIEAQRRETQRAAAALENTKIAIGRYDFIQPGKRRCTDKKIYEVGEYVSAGNVGAYGCGFK